MLVSDRTHLCRSTSRCCRPRPPRRWRRCRLPAPPAARRRRCGRIRLCTEQTARCSTAFCERFNGFWWMDPEAGGGSCRVPTSPAAAHHSPSLLATSFEAASGCTAATTVLPRWPAGAALPAAADFPFRTALDSSRRWTLRSAEEPCWLAGSRFASETRPTRETKHCNGHQRAVQGAALHLHLQVLVSSTIDGAAAIPDSSQGACVSGAATSKLNPGFNAALMLARRKLAQPPAFGRRWSQEFCLSSGQAEQRSECSALDCQQGSVNTQNTFW